MCWRGSGDGQLAEELVDGQAVSGYISSCSLLRSLWVRLDIPISLPIAVLIHGIVNAWHRRGLGGGMVIPPFLSPFRIFVLPTLQRFVDSLR